MTAITRTGCASPAQAVARDTSSDETLVKRIAGGDQLAMRTLFARHRVAIYRWLLRIVHDETLAEDLLSDVFLDVWRQAASFEGRASVSTWLLAIARHKALSARRCRIDAELDARIASTVADPADDPETVLQKTKPKRIAAQLLGRAVAGAWRGDRPRLLPRQVGQRGRRYRRRRRGHGQDAHVLCAQETGRPGRGGVAVRSRARVREPASIDERKPRAARRCLRLSLTPRGRSRSRRRAWARPARRPAPRDCRFRASRIWRAESSGRSGGPVRTGPRCRGGSATRAWEPALSAIVRPRRYRHRRCEFVPHSAGRS